ncbi:sirohydrochlorin cobaltochelatase [Clostridium saccharobutylicum]|uniref:Sirohydrochlorin cobaltochelatase n=1 Tax=Clostridium saccharobutylicum TaxID=169679 RepID=A0A1S8MTH0_CLOSA|nr:sirohydrochlorin cobaltochelatase [Clostridium saccharobutylicum]OOM07454.1 sirohydrochlorin cobaltochelatase [Clostridium saccharobutylicum]
MKKAILVVSFGTSHLDALKNSIDKIENRIKDEFKGYDVFRAFTAHMIIKKLKVTHDMVIFTPEEALEDLKNKGYEEVVVQPLHIIPGEEFDYIKGIVRRYNKNFESIKLGRPIFFYQGMDELPKDYSLFIESIKDVLNNEESVVLFGHGTAHSGNAVYGMLQTVLEDEGYDNVFVATVEGYPTIQSCLNRMKKKGVTKTKLVPLLLVAGDHAKNDMASDEEDSLKSVLQRNDIEVKLYIHGLGEIDSFGDLYITRIYDTIEDRYLNAGKTKKLRKH